jgi:DNA-binding HxlR family transcriptional regulator
MKSEKITDKPVAAPRRWYDDACAAAHALDLVGERWALLVMRELVFGPKRFNDLRAGLPGISANVLTQRLEGLEAAGVVRRRRLPPPAPAQVYELTEWGRESEPVFMALGRWAARSPAHDPTLPLSAASLLLSLRTMLDPAKAEGIEARIGLRLGVETFLCRLGGGGSRSRPARSTARTRCSRAPWPRSRAPSTAAASWRNWRGGFAARRGRPRARRVVRDLFPLPPKARRRARIDGWAGRPQASATPPGAAPMHRRAFLAALLPALVLPGLVLAHPHETLARERQGAVEQQVMAAREKHPLGRRREGRGEAARPLRRGLSPTPTPPARWTGGTRASCRCSRASPRSNWRAWRR